MGRQIDVGIQNRRYHEMARQQSECRNGRLRRKAKIVIGSRDADSAKDGGFCCCWRWFSRRRSHAGYDRLRSWWDAGRRRSTVIGRSRWRTRHRRNRLKTKSKGEKKRKQDFSTKYMFIKFTNNNKTL